MEKRYYNKYISVKSLAGKNARAVFVLNATIMIIISSYILLNQEAKGSSSGSQVFIHVTGGKGSASVCVYSETENLGCRTTHSPDTVAFVFNPDSIGPGQKFKACIRAVKLYCTTSTYDGSTERANHVYLSVPELSNDTNQGKKPDPAPGSLPQPKSYSQHFLLYTNPDHDFKIWYPSDWSISEKNITHSGVVIASPDMVGKVLVSAMNLSPIESKMSPSELAASVLSSQNNSRSRFVELDANNYFLSGHPALKIVQIRNTDAGLDGDTSGEYKSMSLITLVEGKAYFVSYIAQPEIYPNYLQTAQTIIDSFEITSK
jgi:hypothetical protein